MRHEETDLSNKRIQYFYERTQVNNIDIAEQLTELGFAVDTLCSQTTTNVTETKVHLVEKIHHTTMNDFCKKAQEQLASRISAPE